MWKFRILLVPRFFVKSLLIKIVCWFFQEGQISEAESSKLKLEQAQRERRGQMEEMGKIHEAKWFTKKNNSWTFQESYWNQRNDPTGFENVNLLDLW